MKSSIILFLLFALINSKKEFKSLIENVNDIFNEEDILCEKGNNDEKTCLNTFLPTDQIECCYLSELIGDLNVSSICSPIPSAFKIIKTLETLPVFKAAERETLGFIKYNEIPLGEEEESIGIKLQCRNDEIVIKEEKYTAGEKMVLTNENHCLNLFMNSFSNLALNPKCEYGLLLDSSKNAGLECGYVSLNIKLKNNFLKVPTFNTCLLFDINVYDKIVNSALGDGLKKLLKESINQIIGKFIPTKYQTFVESFRLDFYDTKGNLVSYNSTIDDYHVQPINPDDSKGSKGSLLTISKYLLLFGFIIF